MTNIKPSPLKHIRCVPGDIAPIVKRWFEPFGKPGDALQAMFLLNGLPE